MAPLPQDRLVRKEVALGVVREMPVPETHIGLRLLAPWKEVESDDVIFEYAAGLTTGLAPARAEDAESELAQKDETTGFGRAALIDWALKDHYDPSDVSRYRELASLGGTVETGNFPLTIGRMTEGFQARLARDTRSRRRKLDNRIEWMITQALETGGIVYNDGRIKFSVNFGRPEDQTDDDVSAAGGSYWTEANSDPIGDLLARRQAAKDRYGVTLGRAIVSERVINNMMNSDKFHNSLIGSNPLYTVEGWGVEAAARVISRATGIDFIVYDSVYRTRDLGSLNWVNNRFLSDNKIFLLPNQNDIDEIDDMIGFGGTLTSPHPEGNWQSGFYEWERSTVDPWGYDVGTGVKAFPIFPHLDLTWSMIVLPPQE
jgi:hypothetical protein